MLSVLTQFSIFSKKNEGRIITQRSATKTGKGIALPSRYPQVTVENWCNSGRILHCKRQNNPADGEGKDGEGGECFFTSVTQDQSETSSFQLDQYVIKPDDLSAVLPCLLTELRSASIDFCCGL